MSHFNFMTLCSSLFLLSTIIGCADQETELNEQNVSKSLWEEQYGNNEWGLEDQDDNSSQDFWSNDDSTDDVVTTHHTVEASLGGYCAPGCIWSAYAVNTGAQSAEASCNGESCACVVNGDIFTSCSESPDSDSPSDTDSESDSSSDSDDDEGSDSSSASNSSSDHYNASVGNQIADEAYYIATRRNTVGYCYSAAADAIEAVVGRFLWGASAYMAADQLAAHPRFFEVSVSDLRTLPAGAVVVWGRGSSPHGHISIALGDGREASDHVAPQMTYHYGGGQARVFYPN